MRKRSAFIALMTSFLALLCGFFAISLNSSSAIQSRADEALTSEVISSENLNKSSEEKADGNESIVSKATDWIENKVVPLLGGVSIATLVGVAVSIATAIVKVKGDKANKSLILAQDCKILGLNGVVEELKDKLSKSQEIGAEAINRMTSTLNEAEKAMEQVASYAKSIVEQVSSQNIRIEHVEEMKQSIESLCELVADSLSISVEAVKSGIAEKALSLIETLKGGSSDGQSE